MNVCNAALAEVASPAADVVLLMIEALFLNSMVPPAWMSPSTAALFLKHTLCFATRLPQMVTLLASASTLVIECTSPTRPPPFGMQTWAPAQVPALLHPVAGSVPSRSEEHTSE